MTRTLTSISKPIPTLSHTSLPLLNATKLHIIFRFMYFLSILPLVHPSHTESFSSFLLISRLWFCSPLLSYHLHFSLSLKTRAQREKTGIIGSQSGAHLLYGEVSVVKCSDHLYTFLSGLLTF